MSDLIVYGQKELEAALDRGKRFITLCAGIYDIPCIENAVFDRLGPVKVSVRCTRREAEGAGMIFDGIYPEYKGEYASDFVADLNTVAAISCSSGSFINSFSSNIGSGGYLEISSQSGSFAAFTSGISSLASFGSASGSGIYILGYGINLI